MSAIAVEQPMPEGTEVGEERIELALPSAESTSVYSARKKTGKSQPALKLVSPLQPMKATRGTFIAIVVAILGFGLVAMLVINTSLAQGSFTVMDLKAEQRALLATEEALAQQVARAASPVVLEQRARAMGMVASPSPAFLRVTDGTVLGKPKPAPGNAAATVAITLPSDTALVDSTAIDDASLVLGGPQSAVAPGSVSEDALWSEVAPMESTIAVDAPLASGGAAPVARDPGSNVDILLEASPVVQ